MIEERRHGDELGFLTQEIALIDSDSRQILSMLRAISDLEANK